MSHQTREKCLPVYRNCRIPCKIVRVTCDILTGRTDSGLNLRSESRLLNTQKQGNAMKRFAIILATITMVGTGAAFLTADEPDGDKPESEQEIATDLDVGLESLIVDEDEQEQRESDGNREERRERAEDREEGQRREREEDQRRERDGERRKRDGDREEGERRGRNGERRDDEREQPRRPNEEDIARFRNRVATTRSNIAELTESGQREKAAQLERQLAAQIQEFERWVAQSSRSEREREEAHSVRREREQPALTEKQIARYRAEIEDMRARIAEFAESGQREKAAVLERHLAAQLRELEQAIRRGHERKKPRREGDRIEHAHAAIEHLHVAAEHLAAAGLRDAAHFVAEHAQELSERIERGEEHGKEHEEFGEAEFDEFIRDLEKHEDEQNERIEKLSRHVDELNDVVNEIREALKKRD